MATRYEIMAALVDAQADQFGDQSGWHHVVVGVLRELHEAEQTASSADVLREAIYSRIVSAAAVKSFDEPEPDLEPGEYDPATGRYNPGDDS